MTTYYIDPDVAGPGTGTEADPFKLWSSVTWAAGNTYLQKRGTTANEQVTVGASGTSGSPILIAAYGSGGDPIIDAQSTRARCLLLFNLSNIYVFDFVGVNSTDSTFHAAISGDNIKFTNCRAYDFDDYGFYIDGITNLEIIDTVCTSLVGIFNVGIEIRNAASGTVSRAEIYNLMGDGIMLRQNSGGMTIKSSKIYGRIKDVIALEGTSNVELYNNTFIQEEYYGTTYPVLKLGDDFTAGVPALNNTIKNNIFFSATTNQCVAGDPVGNGNILDYNQYFVGGRSASYNAIKWNETGNLLGNIPIATFQANSYETDGAYGDPNFISQLSNNFNLGIASPCIGAGTTIADIYDYYDRPFREGSHDIGAIRAKGFMPNGLYKTHLSKIKLRKI